MEAGVDSQEERDSIKEAQKFLEDNIHPDAITDPYTAALVAYALTLRKSDYAPTAESILSNMAIRKGNLSSLNGSKKCILQGNIKVTYQ